MISKESFSDALFQEIAPLAQKCWDEGTRLKGEHCSYHEHRNVQIEPDIAAYQRLSEARALCVLTMREDTLVGYAVAHVYKSPHHQKLIVANVDSMYVEPKYRGQAAVMIRMLLQELQSMGAMTAGWAVSQGSQMYELLVALGFVSDEIIMEKLLCAS